MFVGWLFGVGGLAVGDRAEAVRLTRDQRAALFAGNAPAITGDGVSPWTKGDRYELSSLLAIVVLRVDTAKSVRGESWRLHYLVDDRRDPVRLVRKNPPVAHYSLKPTSKQLAKLEEKGRVYKGDRYFDQDRYPRVVPEGEAAEESAYGGGGSTVPSAGEAPDRNWVDENAKQRRLRDLKGHDEARSLAIQLKEAGRRARRQGVDVSPELERLREELDGLLRKLDEAA